jgi:hypothetical protein
MKGLGIASLSVIFLVACASIPEPVSNAPENSPTVAAVRTNGERFKG